MSQPNLLMIPIDESILLPMESLDQHLADSSKPNIIAPILRNILLQYGEPPFELLTYSETLPQEPMELSQENNAVSQEQIALPKANILTPSENIVLPLGIPPNKNEIHDVTLENQRQGIAFIKRSTSEKRPLEKTQSIENDINNVDKEVKRKPLKRSKMSIVQIAEKLAMSQSEIKEPMPSTSTAHDSKSKQDTDQSSASKKKGKSKKPSKRKEISGDHDKGAKKKKTKNDSFDSDKEPKKKKSKKSPVDKESEKTKATEKAKERKTSSKKKKKSSKKSKEALPLQVQETAESPDIKEKTQNSKRKETVKRRSIKDNLSKYEEESNVSSSSPAKRPRRIKLDVTDPIYLEPFKHGWIREVVYRTMKDKKAEKKADTYYYSPEGKKFRTRKEMIDTLYKHDHLTEDHFIFYPRPIGLNDSTKEIVRDSFTTSVLQKKGSLKKSSTKSRKSSSRQKKSSQENSNRSLNNSQQNMEILVPENVEDTSINNSELKEITLESALDETNDNEAVSDEIVEPKPDVSQEDTTAVARNSNIIESNSLEKSEESAKLDNGEYLENQETLMERNSPKLEFNPVVQNQFDNQHNTKSKSVSSEENVIKNDNLSNLLTNIDQITENTENESIRSIDLVDHLNKEIKSSSFNNVTEEVDSNKDEISDTERKINDYSDDSNQSDYRLELEPVPEKNLEELNSSFSKKMVISEALMTNRRNHQNSSEEKSPLQKIERENLNTEKESLSNFDCLKSIDSENETKELNLNKVSVPESHSTSSDLMEVTEMVEKINSINKTESENLIIGKVAQSNLEGPENIKTEKTSANSKSDNISLEISSDTSDTAKVRVADEKTISLTDVKTDNLITEQTPQSNLDCTERIETEKTLAALKSHNESEVSTNSSDIPKVNVTDGKIMSLIEMNTEDLTIEQTSRSNLDCTERIETEETLAALKSDDESEVLTSSSDTPKVNVTDGKITSLTEKDTEDLTTEQTSRRNLDCTERIESEETLAALKSDDESEVSSNSSDTPKVNVTDGKIMSLIEMNTDDLTIEQTSRSNLSCTESTDCVVPISNDLNLNEIEPENPSNSSNLMKESDIIEDKETDSLQNIETCDPTTDGTLGDLAHIKSLDSAIVESNDIKSDDLLIPNSPLITTKATDASDSDDDLHFFKTIIAKNFSIENKSESNLGCAESINVGFETPKDLNSSKDYVLESKSTLTDLKNVSVVDAVDEKKNSQRNTDTVFSTVLNSLERNFESSEIGIPHDLKSDELTLLKNSSTLSISLRKSDVDEKTSAHNNPDDDNSTASNVLKNKDNQTSRTETPIEIIAMLSQNTLSTTLSVTSSDSSVVSSDSAMLTSPTSNSDLSPVTLSSPATLAHNSSSAMFTSPSSNSDLSRVKLSSSATLAQSSSSEMFTSPRSNSELSPVKLSSSAMLTPSSSSAMFTNLSSNSDLLPVAISSLAILSQSSNSANVASSSNVIPKLASESISSIDKSLSTLVSTTANVTKAKTISSSETLSTSSLKKTGSIERLIGLIDIKDSFDDVKTLVGGIKKVDQGLYNTSESFGSDSAENTYLVNTEGNTFSFTTASFKQSKKLSSNKEISVSQFKDDINCMKTIAESIKTLNLPSDLTNKQYCFTSPDALTNKSMKKTNSSSEVKFDNINLNVFKQLPSQEENFDIKPCCSKGNISKTDSSDCIQKEKSPSIVISHSKTVWLESNNPNLSKSKKLISEINQSSDLKKMSTHLNESELSNLSEMPDSSSCTALSITIKSSTSKSEYQSAASNSQDFVRSQSYEYQSSAGDEDTETCDNLNETSDILEDTISTLSVTSNEDNSTEPSNLYESSTVYEDYLVSNELSEMIDELAEKREAIPNILGAQKSVELHNDLCEFIQLPLKKCLTQNRQLVLSEQPKNKSSVVTSNVIPVAIKETTVVNNSNSFTINLIEKETDVRQAIKESNLCKLTTVPSPKLLKTKESNSRKVVDENIYPVLPDVPATVSKNSKRIQENNFDHEINNLCDLNLQKLDFATEAVAESQYSFECSPEILVELNNLLQMSDENVNEANQSVNVLSPKSTKLTQENSKLKDISNSPHLSDSSRKIPSMKPVNQSTPLPSSKREKKKMNFQSKLACNPHSMLSFCAGYSALKHIFEYLNFEDLLIAMDVCTVWREVAEQPHLWKIIRIRNSQLTKNLASILQKYATEHLLVVEEDSSDWKSFIKVLPKIKSLRVIELCPCPAIVFEEIVKNCPQLKIVNALSLQDKSINVHSIQNLSDPEKLHLGGVSSMSMIGDLTFLSGFSNLTHLSLRSIKDLGNKNVNVLQSCQELEFLELGECSEFVNTFGSTILVELKNLKRLRLEKVEGPDCCIDILTSVSKMEKLTELELVNFEVTKHFLTCLPMCQNIKKLLIIPMYGKRMAFINNIIIKSTAKMKNLVRLVWGIPEEFVKRTKSFSDRPYDDCISVLKPIPFQKILDNIEIDYVSSQNTQITDSVIFKMLPLPILRSLYAHILPRTETDILKIPTYAIWNLTLI